MVMTYYVVESKDEAKRKSEECKNFQPLMKPHFLDRESVDNMINNHHLGNKQSVLTHPVTLVNIIFSFLNLFLNYLLYFKQYLFKYINYLNIV